MADHQSPAVQGGPPSGRVPFAFAQDRQPTLSPSVRFACVTKIYHLGSGVTSLRSALTGLPGRLLRARAKDGTNRDRPTMAALDGVSFDIAAGESVGFIGPNGSGKTTTLKLLSSITRATSGSVRVRGRVSALIELGAGFHPDLTGRENIYFNAAILGMRRQEIQERFDAIVGFSGIERFLDTPVKRYSSGMYCRLGFAVAAYVNPDVLLVDEVLAVGDAAFQAKCLKRMSELRAGGTTIIFVTHNLGYLQRLCQRAILLYRGTILADGPVAETVQAYRNHAAYRGEESVQVSDPTGELLGTDARPEPSAEAVVCITGMRLSRRGEPVQEVSTGEPLTIHVGYRAAVPVENANVEVWLYGMDGAEYASFATAWDGLAPLRLEGAGEIGLEIEPMCLMPATYFVNVAISDPSGLEKYDMHWERHRLTVLSGPTAYGLVYLPHKWRLGSEGD